MKKSITFRFNSRWPGYGKVLGHREAEIMDTVWDLGSATVAQVVERLGKKDNVAYTTIMTIMGRLQKKGLLSRKVSGKAYLYTPTVTREEFGASVVRGLLNSLLADFSRPALSYFIKNLSVEDEKALDELDKIIEERKRTLEKPDV